MSEAGRSAGSIRTDSREGWRILRLAPPAGRFDAAMLATLAQALEAALADPGCTALALVPQGSDLCLGAADDLAAPGPEDAPAPPAMALLDALCDRIASAPKPVVAVLQGRCASAGLALALAARGRVALPGAVMDLPELRLGRLPAGCSALRLMWLLGAGALDILSAGRAVAVGEWPALALPATDADLERALAAQARAPAPPAPERAALWAAVMAARAALPRPLPALRRHEGDLLDTLEAAILLPPEQALEMARARAADCAERPEARALQHLARAARRAPIFPEGAAPPLEGPLLVALPPALSAQIVPPLLLAGQKVVLWQPQDSALDAALEAVALALDRAASEGRITAAMAEAAWTGLRGQTDAPARALPAALATPALAAALPAGMAVILWGRAAATPGTPVLLPAPVRLRDGLPRLVECVIAPGTPAPLVRAARDLVLALARTPLRCEGAGVIAPMMACVQRAVQLLLEAGAGREALAQAPLPREALFPAPTVAGASAQAALPFAPERLVVLALIAEGMRLLEAGRVMRPSDLDVAMVRGAGYAAERGGPFGEADAMGALVLRSALRRAQALDALWAPPPLLDELIRNGWRLGDLNA